MGVKIEKANFFGDGRSAASLVIELERVNEYTVAALFVMKILSSFSPFA